jgi:quercetin dioxygenase-like cupin family protein
MKQLAIEDNLGGSEQPGYGFLGVRPSGPCRSSLFAPPGFALQMSRATLAGGTELHWSPHAGDEVLYVISGSVTAGSVCPGSVTAGSVSAGDQRCPAGGVLLVDEGAALHVQAESETVLLHFGRQDTLGRPAPGAGRARVQVVGPAGTYATSDAARDTRFYAESDEDFSATFFYTGRTGPYRSLPHSHSQDEIIYVAAGSITLGARQVPAGSAIAVPSDRRYGFVGEDAGFALLNYRRGPSRFSGADGDPPFLEGGRATGMARVLAPDR